MIGKLILEDGTELTGTSFGAEKPVSGEVVFSTGMVGYPESFTDPSWKGQILILTYPLIGNYGVPNKESFESEKIHISGLVVSEYIDTPSHFQSKMTLAQWLKKENVPALIIKDTRFLTQKIRTRGVILGKIVFDKDIPITDPNKQNLVASVSTKKIQEELLRPGLARLQGQALQNLQKPKTVVLIDCGAKENIKRCLLKRNVKVITVPWDYDPFDRSHLGGVQGHLRGDRMGSSEVNRFDAIVISNGPGDPKMATETINIVKKALDKKIPTLGICLGNQILALASGGDTYKLKFGHRGQNQPCILEGSKRCFITTQNHGFAVGKIPPGFKPWFINANDNTNEGIIHEKLPFMSVQFHPESTPGPTDTEWIFDYFIDRIR